MDDHSGGEDYESGSHDDLSLPKGLYNTSMLYLNYFIIATVGKIIHEMLPLDISCSKETRDLLVDCCVEFIHLISSEANELCEKENKKTISPEHIVQALEVCNIYHIISLFICSLIVSWILILCQRSKSSIG